MSIVLFPSNPSYFRLQADGPTNLDFDYSIKNYYCLNYLVALSNLLSSDL
ncbi:hypothetical protein LM600918_180003 [Listeria monocytogenes]|nr:hypothetical protein LM600444_60296 [Listeria monocytogenes]CUK62306.1 hypothetical protein LM600918_180003 [Listeria monocytogenes]CUK98080.1 hypothetical protein LM701042_60296 [Listeria monocytogenes]